MAIKSFQNFVIAFALVTFIASPAAPETDRETQRWINTHPRIKSIVITGNQFFSDSEIKGRLFSATYGFLANIKHKRRCHLHRETILRDTSEVKVMYLQEGFLSVKIQESFEMRPDSSAIVRISITEGSRYTLAASRITGEFKLDRRKVGEIMRDLKPGKALNPLQVRRIQLDLKRHFANSGYPYATINYIIDTSVNVDSVKVIFEIDPDSLARFGKIEIEGAEFFGSDAVRRELKIREGNLYRRDDILNSQKRLLRSGYFTSAQIHLLEENGSMLSAEEKYNPPFLVKVKERRRHYVSIRTGFAQDSVRDLVGELSLGWGKRNVFTTRRFELSGDGVFAFAGQNLISHTYRLRYVEPWFLGIRMPLSVSFEIEPGVRSLLQPFRIRRSRIDIQTEFRIEERFRLSMGGQYESVRIYDVDAATADSIRQTTGNSVRRKLYAAIRRDSRDHIFVPRHGTISEGRVEYFGGLLGGDANFVKFEGSFSRYKEFYDDVILATRVKGGYIAPFGSDQEAPSIDRFYVGGANSIRGYSKDELGPQGTDANGNPLALGAQVYILFNFEIRQPIFYKFWSSLFFDAGNGWDGPDDKRISIKGTAYSYGVGVQYLSPAGPIRLDYATRIPPDPLPAGSRWHFTILYAF